MFGNSKLKTFIPKGFQGALYIRKGPTCFEAGSSHLDFGFPDDDEPQVDEDDEVDADDEVDDYDDVDGDDEVDEDDEDDEDDEAAE